MKLEELLRGTEVLETNASPELEIAQVRYDSRAVGKGDLFVAVTGFAADGHRFIPSALERGAAAVLCERRPEEDIPFVRVRDSRAALSKLGVNRFADPSAAMQVIGVTGTNGKTTVTWLVKALLEKVTGSLVGLVGTIENRIGALRLPAEHTTPESYDLQALLAEMRDAGCKYAVMEVSSHALELHRVDGVRFAVGAFTNLTEDHLDFHKTMENYAAAKAKLFSLCREGVFDADDAAAGQMMRAASCICHTVGTKGAPELLAKNIALFPDRTEMTLCEGENSVRVKVGIPGRFTVDNVLVAVGIARRLGISLQEAAQALQGVQGVKGRVEVVPTPEKPYTVLIDYAHTPDALENVLRSVRGFTKGRVLVLFGCGGDRDRLKRPLMGKIAADNADLVIVTSDNPRTEVPMDIINDILAGMTDTKTKFVVEENRRKAIRIALSCAKKDDILVLAGKGHETYQIIGTQKTHFDEREEVAAALAEGL